MGVTLGGAVLEARVRELFRAFGRRRDGATAIEYAILASMIAVVLVAALATTGTNLGGVFQRSADSMETATN